MSFDVVKLTPRHYKILDYCVAGLTAPLIAQKLDMTSNRVGIIMASPSFQHQLSLRRSCEEETQAEHNASIIDETRKLLQDNTKAAAQKLIDGMSSGDERIQVKSASEVLDRGGYPKEQKIAGMENRTQIIINSSDLSNITESLKLDTVKSEEVGTITGSNLDGDCPT